MKPDRYEAVRGDAKGDFFVANGRVVSRSALLDGRVGNRSRGEAVRNLRDWGFTVRKISIFGGIVFTGLKKGTGNVDTHTENGGKHPDRKRHCGGD